MAHDVLGVPRTYALTTTVLRAVLLSTSTQVPTHGGNLALADGRTRCATLHTTTTLGRPVFHRVSGSSLLQVDGRLTVPSQVE